jgi:hypothetical protein
MSDFLVQVVVLNWNGCADTVACLDSLNKQVLARLQVILVDNHSGDNTVASVRERFPGVKIIQNQENLGYAGGNNVGIQEALKQDCDYILVLNNDTVLDPKCIVYLVQEMDAYPSAAAVSPISYFLSDPEKVYFAGGEITHDGEMKHIGYGLSDNDLLSESQTTKWLSGCAILFRKGALRQVGLFDPSYFLIFEDSDWSLRAVQAGYQLRIVPQAKIWHKVSSSFGGNWNLTFTYYYYRNQLYWIGKNFSGRTKIRYYLHALFRIFNRYRFKTMEQNPQQFSNLRKVIRKAIFDFVRRKFGKQELTFLKN